MARGDKKNNIDGWRIVGKDALGRPVLKKTSNLKIKAGIKILLKGH